MPKIGLFFGSNTGQTEAVAYIIKEEFEKNAGWQIEVHNIGASTPEQILAYELLIFGIPTWNVGQLQDDWDNFMPRLAEMNFQGKRIAIFGLGDQNGYGFNFLDAVGMLADVLFDRGATLLGLWDTKGYEFNESRAQIQDHFLGLGIDEVGQPDSTSRRIKKWIDEVKFEFTFNP